MITDDDEWCVEGHKMWKDRGRTWKNDVKKVCLTMKSPYEHMSAHPLYVCVHLDARGCIYSPFQWVTSESQGRSVAQVRSLSLRSPSPFAVRGVAGRWRNLIIKRKKARVNTGAPVMRVKEMMIQQCLMRSAQHKIKWMNGFRLKVWGVASGMGSV